MGNQMRNFTDLQIESLIYGNEKIQLKEIAELLQVSERTVKRKIEKLEGKKIKEINLIRKAALLSSDNMMEFEKAEMENFFLNLYKQNSIEKATYFKLLKMVTLNNIKVVEPINREKATKIKYLKLIKEVNKAIDSQKQVIIPGYYSFESGISENRYVTPISLNVIDEKIYALEKGRKKCFNFNRIGGKVSVWHSPAESNSSNWPIEVHKDIFGYSKFDGNLIYLKISLDPLAYSLLIHDFPAFKGLKKETKDSRTILEFEVVKIDPIARFICGLLDRIIILDSEEAKLQIQKYFLENVMVGFQNNFHQ